MKKRFLIFLFLLCSLLLNAQDLHFSQLIYNPQNLNAAEIGFFDGDIRANAVIRNQWKSVPVPYKTNCLAVDFSRIKKIKNLNVGLLFNNDVSGDSKYTQNQIFLGLSKTFKLNSDSTFLISAGVQQGLFSNSFQTQNLTFDSQYNGTLYDASLANGENFSSTKQTYSNTRFGAVSSYKYNSSSTVKIGFSVQNVLASKVSFFNNSAVVTNPKFLFYATAEHSINKSIFVMPTVYFQQREKNKEFVFGASLGKTTTIKSGETFKPYSGIFLRNNDACFLQFGAFYNQFNFALSYDINYSKLKTATSNKGAIEFSLIYIFKKQLPFVINQKFCPVFL